MSNSILKKFNTKFQEFLAELIETYSESLNSEFIKYYENINMESDEYLSRFYTHMKVSDEMLYKENLELLKRPFLKFVNLNDLSLNTGSLFSIYRYFKMLYIYAYKYNYKGDINELIRATRKDRVLLKDNEQMFLKIVKSLNSSKKTMDNLSKQITSFESEESTNDNEFEDQIKNSFKGMGLPGTEQLLGGGIGKLAMEIAKDINVDDLNLGNPQELLSGLLGGGKMDKNSGVMNLFSKITNKIHTKLNSGEIDTSQLQKEAQTVMNNKNHPINKMSSMMNNMNTGNMNFENLSENIKSMIGANINEETQNEEPREETLENEHETTEQSVNSEEELKEKMLKLEKLTKLKKLKDQLNKN